jgi:hypothetical protein
MRVKKFLVLALAAVLVLSIVSVASAGTISWTGDLREWYYSVHSDVTGKSLNTFAFDRVELQFVDAFNDKEGLSALFQWRNYASNDTSYSLSSDGKKVTSSGTKQARLDSGFYYRKGLFSKYDEIDIGALDKTPFRLGLSKNCNFVDTGLGSKLKIGNSTGVRYEIDDPKYTVGVGLVNANMKDVNDTLDDIEGFAYSVRLDAGKDFFGMVPGLRLGYGYNRLPNSRKATDTQPASSDNYTTNEVVDIAYVQKLYWASWEHARQVETKVGKDDPTATADYVEAGVNIGKHKVWVGRLLAGDTVLKGVAYKDNVGGSVIKDVNQGTIIAGIYAFPNKISLQGQYIRPDKVNGESASEFDLRFRYDF